MRTSDANPPWMSGDDDEDDDDLPPRRRGKPPPPEPDGPIVDVHRAVRARIVPRPELAARYTREAWELCADAAAMVGLLLDAGEAEIVAAAVRAAHATLTAQVNRAPDDDALGAWRALRRAAWWVDHGRLDLVERELAGRGPTALGPRPDSYHFRRVLRGLAPEPPPLDALVQARRCLRLAP